MPIKERHWNSLVSNLQHGQCVLVLGSEVPINDQLTTSSIVADQLRSELESDGRKINAIALPAVAQIYEDAEGFGRDSLRSTAANLMTQTKINEASPVYASIASLPFPFIVTTSQSKAFYNALLAIGKEPISYRYHFLGDRRDNPEFATSGSVQCPLLYHLFGDTEEPLSLVLSENDLLDFLIAAVGEKPPMPNSFKKAMQRVGRSFLFLGFGVTNWYLRILLKVIVRSLELHRTGSSMALESLGALSDLDRQQTILFYQRGTRVEFYDEDLQTFANELRTRLGAAGGIVNAKLALGPRPRIFISYASEDNVLAGQLFRSLQQANFEPWYDKDALRGGEEWNSKIEEQLRDTDYVLVLQTPSLADKTVGYVNKEISIAKDLAQFVRGSFLIPLRTEDLSDSERLPTLRVYQEMPLRLTNYDEDFTALSSLIRRDFQLRYR